MRERKMLQCSAYSYVSAIYFCLVGRGICYAQGFVALFVHGTSVDGGKDVGNLVEVHG